MSKPLKQQKRAIPKWLLVSGMVIAAVVLILAISGTTYALHLEENDGFCASCHTEPETTFFKQSQSSPGATLAAFHAQVPNHETRCIDCHSGGGTFGRAAGLMQGQTDLLAYYSGHYRAPAVTTNPLSDDSCLKCHGDIARRGDFQNHFHRFLSQWQSIDPNAARCTTCHAAHSTTADAQTYLTVSTVQAVCNGCHRKAGR